MSEQEAGRAERAVRREQRRKDRGFARRCSLSGGHARSVYGNDGAQKPDARRRPARGSRQSPRAKPAQGARRQAAASKAPQAHRCRREGRAPARCRNGQPPRSRKRSAASRPPTRAQGRARAHQSVYAAGRGRAVRAGDRCRRQQGDAGAVRGRRHAGEDGGARRGAGAGADQDHRAVSHQGEERRGAVAASSSRSTAARSRATREALEALPGVGRKTANVVLNIAFGEPTIAVDTHIFRVGNRTGLAPGKTPLEVEMKLDAGGAGAIQAPRPPLADPARALCLRRPPAAVRERA